MGLKTYSKGLPRRWGLEGRGRREIKRKTDVKNFNAQEV